MEEHNPTQRKQMSFNIHPEVHKKVKTAAIRSEMTVNKWMETLIIEALQKQKYYVKQG
jgi:predicted HicB family RNase H-like nuclease